MEKIESLKAETKVVGKTAVPPFIDHFKKHPLYDTFAKFWAFWSAQVMLERLREVHPTSNIAVLEVEFDGPTGGRPDITSVEEATEALQEMMEVEDRVIISIDD